MTVNQYVTMTINMIVNMMACKHAITDQKYTCPSKLHPLRDINNMEAEHFTSVMQNPRIYKVYFKVSCAIIDCFHRYNKVSATILLMYNITIQPSF
jgi:hypothetical protein